MMWRSVAVKKAPHVDVDAYDTRIGCRARNDRMLWYDGYQSVTVTGKQCRRWVDTHVTVEQLKVRCKELLFIL